MNDLDIIKKHLTPEIPFILKNEDGSEDKIMLKPLNIGEQTICFSISKSVEKLKGNTSEMDEKTISDIFNLFSSILKRSLGEIDETILENFILTNFDKLSEIIEKLIPQSKNKEKIEMIKKKLDLAKEAKNGPDK